MLAVNRAIAQIENIAMEHTCDGLLSKQLGDQAQHVALPCGALAAPAIGEAAQRIDQLLELARVIEHSCRTHGSTTCEEVHAPTTASSV